MWVGGLVGKGRVAGDVKTSSDGALDVRNMSGLGLTVILLNAHAHIYQNFTCRVNMEEFIMLLLWIQKKLPTI